MNQPIESDNDEDYEAYVTDEEEKFGFWFLGETYNLKFSHYNTNNWGQSSDDEDVFSSSDYTDDSIEDYTFEKRAEFQRLVLSTHRISTQITGLKNSMLNSKDPLPVSLIHCTNSFILFFIDGIKEEFFIVQSSLSWSVMSFNELFSEIENDSGISSPVFNRVLCSGRKAMIFEMSDKSLYTFRLSLKPEWKRLSVNSGEINSITSSIHCLSFAFIKEEWSTMIYFIGKSESIVSRSMGIPIRNIFTPFNFHVIIDTNNRFFKVLDDYSCKYILTPFETLTAIKQVVGGFNFTIVLLENNTIWASGDNDRVLRKREENTFYRVDISIPNIVSVNAFGNYGVISTPIYHLFFGEMQVYHIQRMKCKRYGINTFDLLNVTIIETENKYFNVDGSEDMIFVFRENNRHIIFQKRDILLFKSNLFKCLSNAIQFDLSFTFE